MQANGFLYICSLLELHRVNKCLFVSVCLLCFCSLLHSCCFLVLVLCFSGCCLLCMLCFLHELFPLIYASVHFGGLCSLHVWPTTVDITTTEKKWCVPSDKHGYLVLIFQWKKNVLMIGKYIRSIKAYFFRK